jgi:LPXTG-motif cell wall-anchored protein
VRPGARATAVPAAATMSWAALLGLLVALLLLLLLTRRRAR